MPWNSGRVKGFCDISRLFFNFDDSLRMKLPSLEGLSQSTAQERSEEYNEKLRS